MAKENITFDQLYKTDLYNKIKVINNNKEDFIVLNDTSEFQQKGREVSDKNTYILIKTYGGKKTALKSVDQSNLAINIMVNTTQPQKWKRILDTYIKQTNSEWLSISYVGDDNYEAIEYNYFQSMDTPFSLQQIEQVGISTRYVVNSNGLIFYSSGSETGNQLKFSLQVESEYVEITNVISSGIGIKNFMEAYERKASAIIKNEVLSSGRSASFFFLIDPSDETHKLILDTFFVDANSDDALSLKIDLTSTITLTLNVSVDSLEIDQVYGGNLMGKVSFVEVWS